jgi:hypothetical protein
MNERRAGKPEQGEGNDREGKNPGPADLTGIFRQVKIPGDPSGPASAAAAELGTDQLPFTQLFEAWSDHAETPPQEAGKRTPASSAPDQGTRQEAGTWARSASAPGEFTEIFQQLPAASTAHSAASPSRADFHPAPVSSEPLQVGGGFTQLLRTLSDEGSRELLPGEAPLPSISSSPQQPGEFTRIISRSAMRDAQLRETVTPALPEAQTAPDFPVPPVSAPAPPPLPLPELARAPAPPPAPAAVAPEARSLGGLEKHLPALVIANLCLTALILILVAALLMRGR